MKISLIIFLLTLISCSSKDYPDKDVCILLYDLKKDKFEEVVNEARCQERFAAASTFKIPLAVMAFDTGLFKSEAKPIFKWNKQKLVIDAWNKDQTPLSWIRESVVWVSQEMTPKIGMEKIQAYLSDFQYGNQDMTAGLKYAWLTPTPFITGPMQNSLKISAYEEVTFLKRLWRHELKASAESQMMTKKIMTHDESTRGSILIGKTGSGFKGDQLEYRLGWFVGFLTTKQSEYVVVVNFSDKKPVTPGSYGGREAKEIAQNLLMKKELW